LDAWHEDAYYRNMRVVSTNHEAHDHGVYSVSFSPCGEKIVSAGQDMEIHVWNATTMDLLATTRLDEDDHDKYIRAHDHYIREVMFSPNGKRIVSCGEDHALHVWNAETLVQEGYVKWAHSGSIWSCHWNAAGTKIVTGSSDKSIAVWDMTSLSKSDRTHNVKLIKRFEEAHQWRVFATRFSPDGEYIAISGGQLFESELTIVETHTFKVVAQRADTHRGIIHSLDWTKDSLELMTCGEDGDVRLWNPFNLTLIKEARGVHFAGILSCEYSHTQDRIATGSKDLRIKILTRDLEIIATRVRPHDSRITAVHFSPEDHLLASGGWDGRVHVFGPGKKDETFEERRAKVMQEDAAKAEEALLKNFGKVKDAATENDKEL